MKISGKITAVLPVQTGEGKNGQWSKQTAVVTEEEGQYPQSLAFDMFGDKIVPLVVGSKVEVNFETKAREFEGKFFNNVNAWKVDTGTKNPSVPQDGAGAPPPVDDLPY